MINKNFTIKKITFIVIVTILFLMQSLILTLFNSKQNIFAESDITISNGNFTSYSSSSPGEPNSFTTEGTKGNTISGVIDVSTETFQEENEENYKLDFNPSKPNISEDNKVLMINHQNQKSNFGYVSSNFTLAKKGYYVVSVYVYTQFNDTASTASLYLSSSTLNDLESSKMEHFSTRGVWKEFRFYVKTASNDENVSLKLYNGTNGIENSFKSAGAVFFDNLTAKSLSESEYYNQINNVSVDFKEIILTSKNVSTMNGILNGDFETSALDFTKVATSTGVSTVGSEAKVVGIGEYFNSQDSKILTEIDEQTAKEFTSANRLNNKFALLINNAQANYVAFESNDILIEQHKVYKLSIDVKTSSFDANGANISLVQTNPFNDESYTVATQNFTEINTSNETNALTNDWITYSFYIKGNVFKDSTAKLTLAVGSEKTYARGYALFDNIVLEEVTTSDYDNNSSATNVKTIDFSNLTESPSINNGALNNVVVESTDDAYPYKASNIDVTNSNDSNFNGIINVNTNNFNSQNYPFNNPVSINNSNSDLSYNNILVLANTVMGYQVAKTDSFNLTASSYYKVCLNINTQSLINENVSIILSNNTETIGQIRNITTNSSWKEIAFYVKTYEEAKSYNLTINFGSENTNNKGYVFIDNLKLETIEEAAFTNATTSALNYTYKTDLSKIDLNIISENADNYIYKPLNFTGTKNSEYGIVEAGIVNVSTHPTLDVGYVENPYVLTIYNITDSYYSYKSQGYTLTSGNYYKVQVSVKTLNVSQENDNKVLDEDGNEYKFGAKIELIGLNEGFTGIVTGNEYETYTFYINATTGTTINFNLSMGDENALTKGRVFFDALSIETIDEEKFTTASSAEEDDKILIIGSTESSTPEDNNTTAPAQTNFDWLLLPTLITALALLIAMIGALIRKLNIKLPVRTKVKDYDRAKTIVKEFERREHLKQREERLQALREKLQQIQNELNATKEEFKCSKSLKAEIKIETRKIDAKIKENYKDVTSKPAIDEARRLKQEAKAKIKQARKEEYVRRRNELITKYLEIEKEIEMILAEERLLVQEYKAYKKQLKLEKAEAKAKKNKKN